MKKSKSDMALAEYEKRPWLKWYAEGVPADVEIPEKSISDMIDEAVKKWGNKTAIVFYGGKMKHKEIHELSLRFATALHDLGVKKGDRVAILLPNCPQYIIAYFGILRLGAVASPMSPLYSPREIKHQVNDSESKNIVCLDLLYENVERVWKETGMQHAIITSIEEYLPRMGRVFSRTRGGTLSAETRQRPEILLFQDLIKKYPPKPPKVEINPKEDLAALPYTGGTTGVPKGAMLTHYNIAAIQEEMYRFFPDMYRAEEERTIALLPFYHIYGQAVIMLTGRIRGGLGILFAKPDLEDIIAAMEKYDVTLFYGVPTLYKYLLDVKRARRFSWKRLKYIFCGADTLHKEVREDWMRFIGKEIREGYGLTETTAVTHTNPPDRNKPGSFGVPLPNTHVAIIDPDTQEFLPPGEEGELVTSAPQVMKGYWKMPEANKESFMKAGGRVWFRTGDIARMDEEGYFYFVERTKDMIKYKGYSVFAHEIEEVLYNHPKVREAAVIGVPDPDVGERVKAIVVPDIDYRGKLTEEEVTEWCEKNLAHYKVPKIIEFRGEIPKTDAFKIDHKKLRAELFLVKEK